LKCCLRHRIALDKAIAVTVAAPVDKDRLPEGRAETPCAGRAQGRNGSNVATACIDSMPQRLRLGANAPCNSVRNCLNIFRMSFVPCSETAGEFGIGGDVVHQIPDAM
jgi:hypothetical protein